MHKERIKPLLRRQLPHGADFRLLLLLAKL